MDDIRPVQNNVPNEEMNTQQVTNDNLPPAPPVTSPGPMPDFGPSPKKSRKGLFAVLAVVLIVAAGAASYLFLHADSSSKTPVASTTSSKKDIPHLTYTTLSYGWDAFYPGGDLSTNYFEANNTAFEGLVRYENKTKIVPYLATGWTNPDSTTWVFKIKKGVKFHTGRKMTAEDVKLSFDAAKSTTWGETFANSIASVTVDSPTQVTIKTNGPDATLLKKLVNYYVYDTKSGKTNDAINGTGPFIVKAGTTPKEDSLEMTAFEGYHGGHVYVRELSFKGSDERDNSKLFDDKKTDIIDTETPQVNRAHGTLNVDPTAVFAFSPNTKKAGAPLSNLKVRQAVNLALDPAAIAKVRGVSAEPIGQIVPSTVTGYNPDIKRPARDVMKAKELLKQAGFPNGVSIPLTFFAPAQDTANEIARELSEAGIKLVLDPVSDVKVLSSRAFSGDTDLFFQTYNSDIRDASDVSTYFIDTPNYSNPEAVNLVKQAQNTFDTTKRLQLLQQTMKLLSDDLGVIPVYVPQSAPITYDSSYEITRDVNTGNNLGIYWFKVYGK